MMQYPAPARMRRCPPRLTWLLVPSLLVATPGCGVAVVAYDTVRGWLGLDDEEEPEAEVEPAGGDTGDIDGTGAGSDTSKTAAAHVEGSSTGKSTGGDESTGAGSTSGKAATGSDGSLPASFPPGTGGSGSGDSGGTGGTGGTDDGSTSTRGADSGGGDATGDSDSGDTGAPTTAAKPSSSEAECLEGTWVAADLDEFLRQKLRAHARGRKVEIGRHSGKYELQFAAPSGGKRELTTTATGRYHHFDAELAGVEVEYTVHLSGVAVSAYEVTSPGLLKIDAPSKGRIAGRLTVDIDDQKEAKRSMKMAADGEFELSCLGDDLTLTPKLKKRLAKPLTFTRK